MKSRRIGIVAPSCPIDQDVANAVGARATALYGKDAPELVFHPQCFLSSGHFAGDDPTRLSALVEYANDPTLDAVWFARGGYGSGRIAEAALESMGDAARVKDWLGYSDAGNLLGGLYGRGFTHVAHGPMCADIRRSDGHIAIDRALRWLMEHDRNSVESHALDAPSAAFNMIILSHMIGTPLQPDLADHVLMLEEVSEHLYRIDRAMFHITSNRDIRKIAGIRLGRVSDIIENDRPFGSDVDEIIAYWCQKSGIPWLGYADIGHDIGNKVVPFGHS